MSLEHAFDIMRFGDERTLNLRAMQPTARQAAELCENWLRSQQVQGATEALIITGRGNRSVDGYSPVRESIAKLLPSLRRRNVLNGYAEHSPGSFVVTFAPVRALFEVPRRRRERERVRGSPDRGFPLASAESSREEEAPASFSALDVETIRQLGDLAAVSLAALGLRTPTRTQLEDEMLRQFNSLVSALPETSDREALLQQALIRALEEYEAD